MKVVHISTMDRAGAGKSALRLHQSLLEDGVDSHFLCKTDSSQVRNKVVAKRKPLNFKERVELKFNRYRKTEEKDRDFFFSQFEGFPRMTRIQSDFRLDQSKVVQDADIINLHWISDFLDWPTFFSHVNKPIVWTLHDMNPFQGLLHYSKEVDQERFKQIAEIDKQLRREKESVLSKIASMNIVCPSQWLLNESKSSSAFSKFDHHHIPYSVPGGEYRPLPKALAKEVFGLPVNKKVILFLAHDVSDRRKGFSYLLDAAKNLKTENIAFALVGRSEAPQANELGNVYALGAMSDERLVNLAYNAADIFVIPSIEDNFPNTIIESHLTGIPVVGFRTGGIEEMIQPQNGVLCGVGAVELAAALDEALNTSWDHSTIAAIAQEKYHSSRQASAYKKVYSELLL